MEPKDRNGPGDGQRPAKGKRAPNARKRSPKTVQSAEENGATATERELTPRAEVKPAQGGPASASTRPATEGRSPGQSASDERRPNIGGDGDRNFAERDAERPADVAADIKSWMDTRREDRDTSREVL
jgi:hypothetical protein